MKYYLAAPVITDDESKKQIDLVHGTLVRAFGVESVYRPGEHKVPNEWGITMEMWGQCVFTMDVLAIDNADWIVLCNYGRKGATAGTAWECGYAFAKKKRILVINMPGVNESSLMITGCASNVVDFHTFVDTMKLESGLEIPKLIQEATQHSIFEERGKLKSKQILN